MKQVVAYVTAHHGYSERRACALTRQHHSTQRKPSIRDPRLELRQRMREIVQTRIPLRLSTCPGHVAPGRLGGEQEPGLPAVS
jgi:hypothetical protein